MLENSYEFKPALGRDTTPNKSPSHFLSEIPTDVGM